MEREHVLDTTLRCCDYNARVIPLTSNFEVDDDATAASTPFLVICSAYITLGILTLVLSYVLN